MKYILFTILFLTSFSCKYKKDDKAVALMHYNNAQLEYSTEGDFSRAFDEINEAINLDSTNNDFKYLRSKIFYKNRQYDFSILELESLAKQGYRKDSVFFYLAKNYFEFTFDRQSGTDYKDELENNYEKTISYIDKATQINPLFYDAHHLKFASLFNQHNFEAAALCLNKMIREFPERRELVIDKAVVEFELNKIDESFNTLKGSLESSVLDSTKLSLGYDCRAKINAIRNRHERAMKDYNTALMYNPKNGVVYYNRGLLKYMHNDIKGACLDFFSAVENGFLFYSGEELEKDCGQFKEGE